jgi:seryl-tRNA synthetase
MIDINLLRKEPEKIKELILRKEPTFPVDKLIENDSCVKKLRTHIEELRKEKNNLAQAGAHGITPELREKSISLDKKIKEQEQELKNQEKELESLALTVPNIPQEDLPVGGKEANKVIKEYGEKPKFSFNIKNHLELNEKLKWFDFQTAAIMSGTNFVLYKEMGVKIIYALTRLMLKNNVSFGFTPILPPYLIHEKALYNSGNLPKFQGDYYNVNTDGLSLIPTAEVSLTNLHANSILSFEQLPLRYTSWTSCFRREAGTHGATERGLIRIHQFEKTEIYSICVPEESNKELEHMVICAQTLLQKLNLHYRISLLATQDCSFPSSRTYDIEVWLPGQAQYYEVSSCSNCTDFQARRSLIRYRKTTDSKPTLVHTLNASSLALPRLMVAIMETGQQKDGSIVLPDVLNEEINKLW